MNPPPAAATVRKLAAVGLLAVFAVAVWPVTASAHTDFESSQPSDGAAVDGPLAEVVVNFTNPARPVGDEFLLLDPSGEVRLPASVDATDGTSFVLTFDPPLTAGTYGLRWEVQAGDAHPANGSFSFAVIEATATATAPSTTAAATTTAVAVPSTTAATTTTNAAAAPSTTGSATSAPPAPSTPDASPARPARADAGASLEAFLEGGGSGDGGETSGRIGRFLTSLGLIFGLGAFAALVWVIRGDRRELLSLVRIMRLTGFAIVAGGLLELAALAAAQSSAALDLLDTEAGFAAALKVAGGLVVLAGFGGRAGRIVTPPQALSAAVGTDIATTPAATARTKRWVPAGRAWPGLAGFAAVLVSFWFDGHTVSRGPWALHAAVNSVHLGAAAVWAGGVFAMTTIVWLRRRAAAPTDLGPMVVRFSTPATVSLIAVMAAGLAMAAVILDQPEDLLDTDWGRVLLAKTTAVAIAAGLGAYNHFRLRPAMTRHPDDPTLVRELRISLTAESVVFVVVLGLTAWLVAAAI